MKLNQANRNQYSVKCSHHLIITLISLTAAELSVKEAKLSSKSSVLDPLPPSLLVKCALDILVVIATIVNISVETSIVPKRFFLYLRLSLRMLFLLG